MNRKSITKWVPISLAGVIAILCFPSLFTAVRFYHRQILFDLIYTSASTGSTAGFFIDSEGNVYSFRNDMPQNKLLRSLIEAGRPEDPFRTRELFQYYGHSNHLVGKIDASTLDELKRLVPKIFSMGGDDPLTPAGCESDDAGVYVYRAFVYNPEYKTHNPMSLYVMGDSQAMTDSQEGQKLYKWLETFCIENDYFAGCKPSSQICRP